MKNLTNFHNAHTVKKIEASDLIFFVIDGSNEITIEDYNCANFLRKYKKSCISYKQS